MKTSKVRVSFSAFASAPELEASIALSETPADPGAAPADAPAPRRKWPLSKKLLLAFGSFAATLLILEVAARLYMPSLSPVLVRDGYYQNPLPLFTGTGGPPIALRDLPRGESLAERKEPGEIRVVVLGESSVEGSPFDTHVSMPAMLYDELRAALPGRDLTVVNMGRSSSVSANVFYYLRYLERYSPDFVVFYMGMNDHDDMAGEQCAPLSHPGWHAAWRAGVSRSWALWLTRTFGVRGLWWAAKREDWYSGECPGRSFHLWTDILLEQARGMGAEVIVATPVISAATVLEPQQNLERGADEFPPITPQYAETLACALDDACDFSAHLATVLQLPPEQWEGVGCTRRPDSSDGPREPGDATSVCEPSGPSPHASLMAAHDDAIDYRADAWRASAETYGADLVEFHRALRETSPHGLLAEDYFADRQHLLPLGYLFLARLVSSRVEARLTGGSLHPVGRPADSDVRPYLDRTENSGVEVAFEQLVRGWYITGVPLFPYVIDAFPAEEACAERPPPFCQQLESARVALGWLRSRVGLDPELPEDLAGRLDDFALREELDAMRSSNRERPPDASADPPP